MSLLTRLLLRLERRRQLAFRKRMRTMYTYMPNPNARSAVRPFGSRPR